MFNNRLNKGMVLLFAFIFILHPLTLSISASAPYLVSDVGAIDYYSAAQSYLPNAGIYRIKNADSGKYITFSDSDTDSTPYLSDYIDSGRQILVLTKESDLSYTIVSQEYGSYLCVPGDAVAGTVLSSGDTDNAMSRFSVTRLSDGNYMITPTNISDRTLSLSCGTDGTSDLPCLSVFWGDNGQRWVLEEIPVSSISVSRSELSMTVGQSVALEIIMIPAKIDGNIVWTSDDTDVAVVNENGIVTAQKNGTAKITATLGDLSSSCTVTVSAISASAFFSQHNIYSGGWDGGPLTYLKFSGKYFAKDRYNYNTDWMDEGCNLCCYAILLSNLGATLDSGYDFRSGKTDNLTPDPYIVALANSGNYGPTNASASLIGDPVSIDMPRMLSRFSVNGDAITATVKKDVTLKQIKDALDEHPEGVIVEFYKSETLRHFVVVTECVNPDAAPKDYNFIICDPAAYDPALGDHVLFTDSTSYTSIGYRYSDIVSMRTLNILSSYDYSGSLRIDSVRDSRIK